MIIWFKVRRGPLVLGLLVITSFLLAFADAGRVLVPAVIGGGASPVGVGGLLPLIWAAVFAFAVDVKHTQVEARPGVGLKWWDFAAAGLCMVAGLAIFQGLSSVPHGGANVVLLTATALLVGSLHSPGAGALAATALLLTTQSYGPSLPGAGYVRILQPEGNTVVSTVVALTIGCCALAALLVVRAPREVDPALDDL